MNLDINDIEISNEEIISLILAFLSHHKYNRSFSALKDETEHIGLVTPPLSRIKDLRSILADYVRLKNEETSRNQFLKSFTSSNDGVIKETLNHVLLLLRDYSFLRSNFQDSDQALNIVDSNQFMHEVETSTIPNQLADVINRARQNHIENLDITSIANNPEILGSIEALFQQNIDPPMAVEEPDSTELLADIDIEELLDDVHPEE